MLKKAARERSSKLLNSSTSDSLIEIGKILKPHGLKGEIKILLFNKSSRVLQENVPVTLKNDRGLSGDFRIEMIRYGSSKVIIKFFELSSIDDADTWRESIIWVQKELLPPVDDDEYYLLDLVGMSVFSDKNEFIGCIKNVLSYPANDVIVLDYKEKEILIPAVDEFIKLIDFEKKCLTIDVIDGLLDG